MPLTCLCRQQPRRPLRRISFLLVLCLLTAWSGALAERCRRRQPKNSWMKPLPGKVRSRKKLNQIDKQRDKLNKQKLDLTGDLAWLKTRTQQQQDLYEQKTNQLQAALEELNQAYLEYIAAENRLTDKRAQYVDRLKVMYEQ